MIFVHWESIFGVFFAFVALSSGSFQYFDFKNQNELIFESDVTMKSIDKTLTYLKEHPESLIDDVILGVLIAKANLQWVMGRLKPHFDKNYPPLEKLARLTRICDDIIEVNKTRLLPVLDVRFWENGAEDLKNGSLLMENDDFRLPQLDSCESTDAYVMQGTPEDSDACLNELFSNKCKISGNCWHSEMVGNSHAGYKTTHRLIYFQVATKLRCNKTNSRIFFSLETVKKDLCQKMLLEAIAFHQHSYFHSVRDLFLEQIALCGLEGYKEFAPKIWRAEVRGWQSKNGCFGRDLQFDKCLVNETPKEIFAKRAKKTDSVIDKCHTHVTAVAVSAMAFHLRVILDTALLLA